MFLSSRRSLVARSKTFVAALLTTALAVSMLSLSVAPAPAAMAAEAGTGTVSGKVFQNYASDPWDAPVDPDQGRSASKPIAGITATAYDATGTAVGSAQSGADGTYKINVKDAFSNELRVEFSGWNEPFEPAFAVAPLTGTTRASEPAAASGVNATSVQLVTLDAQQTVTGVDFGLMVPEEVAQPNAPIVTSAASAGGLAYNSAELPSLIAQDWDNHDNIVTGGTQTKPTYTLTGLSDLANFENTGSTWGVAYSSEENALFTAASLKRMSALGPKGLGGIYRTAGTLQADGTLNAAAETEGWLDLQGLPISNSAGETVDLGTSLVPTEAERDLQESSDARREIETFALVGRVGIGGVAVAPGGAELLAANLYDGHVYAVNIADDSAPESAQRISTPVDEDSQAIWAVSVYQDRLYIGYVDTGDLRAGESADDAQADGSVPGKTAAGRGMQAYVVSTSLIDGVAAVADTPDWKPELTVDLAYAKGSNGPKRQLGNQVFFKTYPRSLNWNSWTNVWSWSTKPWSTNEPGVSYKHKTVGLHSTAQAEGYLQHYPQPILSGISFDRDGYMVLGLSDRTSLQAGNKSLAAMTKEQEDWYYATAVAREKPKAVLWSAIANGDVLVAAPSTAANEPYTLESGGVVGQRGPTVAGGTPQQDATYKNGQGPGGGEFFNDSMNVGQPKPSHDEVGLGATFTYPGSTEVASTVIDPGNLLLTTGVMWFDGISGRATRGATVTQSPEGAGTSGFQKAGGLGGTSLLLAAAPVEIGNRVWLDADLNGRQDADEPAINGAIVELHTVGENGAAGDLIATRTTETIDGQPGTYYFRTDDDDVVTAGDDARSFLANGDYVLVFKKGTLSDAVDLVGPNSDHVGFAGVTWADLVRTDANTPDASTANDSNPDPETGEALITVGGPGENDHTYDAGWYGVNNYELSKQFESATEKPAADTSYTFNVVGAKNFRGEDRLAATTPALSETEFSVSAAGKWAWTATQKLPLGYELELAEAGVGAQGVSWSNPVADDTSHGLVTIVPKRASADRATVTATNHLGEFEVVKTVTGEKQADIAGDVEFKLEYTLNDGDVKTAWVSMDTPFTAAGLSLGTVVKIREVYPIVTKPAQKDTIWGVPEWARGDAALTAQDGWYTFTVDDADAPVSLALANVADLPKTTFSVMKMFKQDDVFDPAQKFTFEYKVSGDAQVHTLGTIGQKEQATATEAYPAGTQVSVREVPPADELFAKWKPVVWSNLPAGATGPDASGWYTFALPAPDSEDPTAPVVFTAENDYDYQKNVFSVRKTVTEYGDLDIADQQFGFSYRVTAPAGAGVAAPAGTYADEGTFSLARDGQFDSDELLVGSIVEVREDALNSTDDVKWATATWSVDGEPATIVDGWVRFEIPEKEAGVEAPGVAVDVDNKGTKKEVFTLQKKFEGEISAEAAQREYPVVVQITEPGGATQRIDVNLNGTGELYVHPTTLPVDTVVRVRERQPAPLPGYTWNDPKWFDGSAHQLTVDAEGWVEFVVPETGSSATLVVANSADSLPGYFQVKKVLNNPDGVELPAEYTLEYKLNGVAQADIVLTAGAAPIMSAGLNKKTTVSLRERDTLVDNVEWTRTWKMDGKAATPDSEGWVHFEIDAGGMIDLEVANTGTKLGAFQIQKTVSGEASALVPNTTEFTFAYSVDGGAEQLITATPATPSELVKGLTRGAKVTVREVNFPKITGVKFGENPKWKINGEAVGAEPVTFTIADGTLVVLEAENPSTKREGLFSVDKTIVGEGKNLVPEDAKFTVEYREVGTEKWIALDTISKQKMSVTSPKFLEGTKIELRESPATAGKTFEWKDPEFSIDGKKAGATASLTIVAGTETPATVVGLKNTAVPKKGTFEVKKSVEGPFDLRSEEIKDLTFTVDWAGDGRKGTLLLNKQNNWTATPEGELFPVDTEITLTEGKIRGKMAPHVKHTNERWLAGADNVQISGKTATVTIVENQQAEQPTLVTLSNEFTESFGSFGVQKTVLGEYQATDQEIANLTFQVGYEASTGETGTIDLNAANGWQAVADQEFQVGAEVTLTETIVDHETLPGDVKWDGAVWAGGAKQVAVSGDKLSAVVTIVENTPAEAELVTLANAFQALTGSFAVQKSVDGDFDLNDPEVRGANFKVAYTAQNGDDITEGTLDLNGGNGWNESSPEFAEGTTVTLTELDPVKLDPSVTWEGYSWVRSPGLTVSPDGKTASFTVKQDNDPTMRFELKNVLTEKTGGFTLEKQVTGTDAELVPDSLEFTVEYSVDGGAVWKKLPAVSKAAPTTKSPKDIRLGTTVLIREVAPATVDGVIWGTPEFSGTGVRGGGTGEPASFVVTSETESIDVLLKNPTKTGLPKTGAASSAFGATMGGLLLLAGALLIAARTLRGSRVRRQR